MQYKLIVPIEMGDTVVEVLNLHKPTLGELTKVRSTDQYTMGLEMLTACADQSALVLKRITYDDAKELMENVLPDFLGYSDNETD